MTEVFEPQSEPTPVKQSSRFGGTRRKFAGLALAASTLFAACGVKPASTPDSLPPRTPDATLTMPQSAEPSTTVAITPNTTPSTSVDTSPTVTPTPEITKAPVPFDVQKLVTDISSGEAKNEYPAVTASALKTEFTELFKTNSDLANVPYISGLMAACLIHNDLQLGSCESATANLVIASNETKNPDIIKLTKDTIGYSLGNVFTDPASLDDYAATIKTIIKKIG